MQPEKFIKTVRDIYQSKDFIPLHEPRFSELDKKYVAKCIESKFVSSVGEFVNDVEDRLADYSQTAKAIAVVNGTAALQISLKAAGVDKGDEVLCQALTFVATTNSIIYNNASPVFIDVDLDTMGMSPKALGLWLNEFGEKRDEYCFNKKTGKRIAACLPMHTFGFMCRIEEIMTICQAWGIPVIEDAAEGLGSSLYGRPAGSWGLFGALSFNGNKIITAGGGGAILSNEKGLAKWAKHLTTTAKREHPYEFFHDEVGYNYRMPNLNAALLLAQLEQIDSFIDNKKKLYKTYQQTLTNEKFTLMVPPQNQIWNYWLMSVITHSKKERDYLLEVTNKNGVMTRPIWQLMFKLPMYAHCQRDDQVNAIHLEERIVNIPSNIGEMA